MSPLRGEKLQRIFFVFRILCFTVLFGFFTHVPRASGQGQTGGSVQVASPPQQHSHSEAVALLQDLLTEAEQNNPQIQAARLSWQAAKQVPSQVSTLPDPQFNVQQVNVGSPRPFAGYTNSDFAYVGLGVTQDLPYPGQLRLKGEMAKRNADVGADQAVPQPHAVFARHRTLRTVRDTASLDLRGAPVRRESPKPR
jgi:Outer membrane efflux protein